MSVVVAVPDLHAPYCDLDSLKKVIALIKKHKPTHVIQLGDAYDLYSFSKFPRNLDVNTPREELQSAHMIIKNFWKRVKNASPKSKLYQLCGNHEARLKKRVAEKLPEINCMVEAGLFIFDFEDVKVFDSDRDFLEIEGIVYCHGWKVGPKAHMLYFQKSVVHGHTHRCSISYDRTLDNLHFEMDCGCLVDESQTPMQYTNNKLTKWVKSVGIIEDGIPRLELL